MSDFKLKKKKKEAPPLMGWECPRCHKVNSPFVLGCDCPPFTFTITADTVTTLNLKIGNE